MWGAVLAVARLRLGDAGGAIEAARTACRSSDQTLAPRIALAAARLAQGDAEAASAAIADARRIKPDLSAWRLEMVVDAGLARRLLELGPRVEGLG